MLNGLALDTEGFRFAGLHSFWDVNFVPGAVKYGDLPGLIVLCRGLKPVVLGEKAPAGAEAVAEALVRKAAE